MFASPVCSQPRQLVNHASTLQGKSTDFARLGLAVHQATKPLCRADEVVVVTEEDLPKRVAEITQGRGAYAVINPIGGEVSVSSWSSMVSLRLLDMRMHEALSSTSSWL